MSCGRRCPWRRVLCGMSATSTAIPVPPVHGLPGSDPTPPLRYTRLSPPEVGRTPMFLDPLYIVLLVVTLGITGWAAWRVRSTYGKWSKVDSGINLDAFDF